MKNLSKTMTSFASIALMVILIAPNAKAQNAPSINIGCFHYGPNPDCDLTQNPPSINTGGFQYGPHASMVENRIDILEHDFAVSRMSIAGHTFTKVINHPVLGDAWQDEDGNIWSDISLNKMLRDDAVRYCQSIDGTLAPCVAR